MASLLWLLYLLVVPKPIDLPPDRLSDAQGSVDSPLGRSLAANLNAPLLAGNHVELLRNGDEIFPAMLTAIREAKTSINLLTYVYWTGGTAESFADALSAAARRGVKVRLLLDAFGARKIKPELIDRMRRAGCEVAWYRPLRWYNLGRYNNRTHRKVMVVDGRIGFTGGVGIAEEWSGDAQDPDHWRDDHFRLQGPVVNYLQGSFSENWHQTRGEVLAGTALFPELPTSGTADIVPVDAAPSERFAGIPFTFWMLFRSARERILIATPYYVPDPDLHMGLIAAARRGVAVTLLVPGPHQDSTLVRYASRTYYGDLLAAGVRLHEYQPTMMHTKVVVVDDAWSFIGSPDFDSRSFELNYEIALAVRDTELAEAIAASFEDDLGHAREVMPATVEDWSMFERARNHLALLLREQL